MSPNSGSPSGDAPSTGRVVVAGSITMNSIVTTDRYPTVGETVIGRDLHLSFGGKGANQAVAARRAGARVIMGGAVGDDDYGSRLLQYLAQEEIDVSAVRRLNSLPTGAAVTIVDAAGHSRGVALPGTNGAVDAAVIDSLPISEGDIAVCSCVIPIDAVARHLDNARNSGATAVVNVAPVLPGAKDLLELADIVIVNEVELNALTGTHDVEAGMRSIRLRSDQVVIATIGSRGWRALIGDHIQGEPGLTVPVVDTTGAGDCFVGSMAGRLAAGATLADALCYANRAAALQVQRTGEAVGMPTYAEVVGTVR